MIPGPVVARTREELHRALGAVDGVALVPTMGALHDGHAALIRRARKEVAQGGHVVVSVFVNPLQFGPGEDLDRYPRTLDADLGVCAAEGVDVVFAPSVDEVYPGGASAGAIAGAVTVDPGPVGGSLEGEFRPTHFRGVLTVVAKLLGLVRPDVAVFGEKDYQQLVLVCRMVADLCMGVRVVGAETVREADGLALSSRNRYLDERQRDQAAVLFRALHAGQQGARRGAEAALGAARGELRHAQAIDLDYLEVVAPDLGPAPAHGEARMLVAARLGPTRLIDNLPLQLGPGIAARTGL